MLEKHVVGRTIASLRLSGAKLRAPVSRALPGRVRGRAIVEARRHGKYLLLDLEGGSSLISHLGMSGRWLFYPSTPENALPHVHVAITFRDRTHLWFQDPRRFGLLRLVPRERLYEDPALAVLGPDPVASPFPAEALHRLARGARVSVKN